MTLTTAQQLTLKNNILADNAFSDPNTVPHNSDGAIIIAAAYNADATPAYIIWRSSILRNECQSLALFDWTRVDNLAVSKARIWEWMFMGNSTIDPSQANVRAGITQCWAGTAADIAVGTAVLNACKRNATRAEKLFATGLGTTNSPSVTVITSQIDIIDVIQAMGW